MINIPNAADAAKPTVNQVPSAAEDASELRPPRVAKPDILALLEAELPTDREAAIEAAIARDKVDAAGEDDGFIAKTRRAVNLEEVKRRKFHRDAGLSWDEFADYVFEGGYDSWVRYRSVARVQATLRQWKLPPVPRESLARAIAPRLREDGLKAKLEQLLADNGRDYPTAFVVQAALSPIGPKDAPAKRTKTQRIVEMLDEVAAFKFLQKEEREFVKKLRDRLGGTKDKSAKAPVVDTNQLDIFEEAKIDVKLEVAHGDK